LVPLIEAEPSGSPLLAIRLQEILDPMLQNGIDTLVLGCTHYPLIKEEIEAICGPAVNVIDPSSAAARQVQRLLKKTRSSYLDFQKASPAPAALPIFL